MVCIIIWDYHGWPVSYEWINSSYLPKIWEQMSMAYDFGVRELWMVNVGDIATQEFPLSFFLDMAYDFDRWGSRALNCTQEYTRKWVRQQFGSVEEETQDTIADIFRAVHKNHPQKKAGSTEPGDVSSGAGKGKQQDLRRSRAAFEKNCRTYMKTI